jgi:hypothetical protein
VRIAYREYRHVRRPFLILAFVLYLILPLHVLFSGNTVIEEPPFYPLSPEIMAQGGSSVAIAEGYNSMFTNPAGFAIGEASLTVPSFNAWVYADPREYIGHLMRGDCSFDYLLEEAMSGGFGMGASTGLAYIGNGLGLGLVLQMDSFVFGPSVAGLAGDTVATLSLIGGYAYSFNVLGIDLSVGAALRPLARIHTPLSNEAALDLLHAFAGEKAVFSALNDEAALHGVGLGIDLGLIARIGSFRLGVSVRDVGGTPIIYKTSPFSAVMSSLGTNLVFPEGNAVGETYMIPMSINAGIAYKPGWGDSGGPVDLILHAEVQDLAELFEADRDLWTHLHIGAEVSLWDRIALRAGLNQGYLTFGVGFDLFYAFLDIAYFTRELGESLGEEPSSGFALEFALRF